MTEMQLSGYLCWILIAGMLTMIFCAIGEDRFDLGYAFLALLWPFWSFILLMLSPVIFGAMVGARIRRRLQAESREHDHTENPCT